MCPALWAQRAPGSWWLRLRCGECGTFREVTADDGELTRLDRDLELAEQELEDALHAFERACMVAEGRCWTRALALDLVDADDFAPQGRAAWLGGGTRC